MLNPRFFYTLALWLLLPYIFLRLLWRARKQPEYLHHIGERFGFYSALLNRQLESFESVRGLAEVLAPCGCEPVEPHSPSTSSGRTAHYLLADSISNQPVIWLHTVSVGETRAAQSLIARLRATYPGYRILLTHTTPTGRAAGEQLYGDDVLRMYLPYDYPFAVRRFLRHFKPQLGILMETEIWFNLIHACRESNVPLLLLNARLSEKSARGYARFARLTREALGELAAVAAQTVDDAARLTALGAKNVAVTGNLKFDIEPPPALLELGRQLRGRFGAARKVFLAASTRDGEEALLLDTLRQVHIPGLLLVIVPRHPQRFAEVAALLEQRGIPFRRRSEMERQEGTIAPEIRAVLGDSMGEMFAYYAAADLAFVGGSLLPYGGQNLIEACAAGAPVLVGPHTHNFAEATRLAVAAGAAAQVQDSDGLAVELRRLLDNPDALREMRRCGAGFVESNRGATDKSLRIIVSLKQHS